MTCFPSVAKHARVSTWSAGVSTWNLSWYAVSLVTVKASSSKPKEVKHTSSNCQTSLWVLISPSQVQCKGHSAKVNLGQPLSTHRIKQICGAWLLDKQVFPPQHSQVTKPKWAYGVQFSLASRLSHSNGHFGWSWGLDSISKFLEEQAMEGEYTSVWNPAWWTVMGKVMLWPVGGVQAEYRCLFKHCMHCGDIINVQKCSNNGRSNAAILPHTQKKILIPWNHPETEFFLTWITLLGSPSVGRYRQRYDTSFVTQSKTTKTLSFCFNVLC